MIKSLTLDLDLELDVVGVEGLKRPVHHSSVGMRGGVGCLNYCSMYQIIKYMNKKIKRKLQLLN